MRHKGIRRPVRFEMRHMSVVAVIVYLILVTVYEVQFSVLIQFLNHFVKCVRTEDIVTVQKGYKLSRCNLKSGIGAS